MAADVVAMVPLQTRYRDRPTGLGLSVAKYPAGSAHTVFVPITPLNAASVVYVFFVTAAVQRVQQFGLGAGDERHAAASTSC